MKRFKKSGRIISFILLTTILLSVFVPGSAGAYSEKTVDNGKVKNTQTSDNPFNKIHFYFENEKHTTIDGPDELYDAVDSVKKNAYSNIYEEVTLIIGFESGIKKEPEYQKIAAEKEKAKSIDDVHKFRALLNSFSKTYHERLYQENKSKLYFLPCKTIESIDYSPFVKLTLPVSELNAEMLQKLSETDNVVSVSLSFDIAPEPDVSWANTLKAADAYSIVRNRKYTGEGIYIGIYEAGGVCDTRNVNLSDVDITLRTSGLPTTVHATNVTSILAAIAPDASFFVSNVTQYGISWFIEQGCDVVNCSFGYYNNMLNSNGVTYADGIKAYRYDIDAIYDYQVETHFITVVVSAGNTNKTETSSNYNPRSKVVSPGLAYNVTTVGGVKAAFRNGVYQWEYDSGAAYVCSTSAVKPDVSAPFTITVPNIGTVSGTSFAAPQVTGYIALLESKNFSYCAYPERVNSVLISTANKTADYSSTIGSFDNKVGAGIVNLNGMLSSTLYTNKYNTYRSSQKDIITKTVYLEAGKEIQIAAFWLVGTNYNGIYATATYVTDYDIRVYAPDGTRVASSLSGNNNELIRMKASRTGTYTIVLFQWGSMAANNSGDWLSLTYFCR